MVPSLPPYLHPGSKFGGGGVASQSATNADRRERLRRLALEKIDLEKDPYFFKNHVGSYECRLCLTVHQNDGSYLAHTQGKKHQTNLSRRAAKEQREGKNIDRITGLPVGMIGQQIAVKKNLLKIGRPGYKITKCRDPVTRQQGLLFQLQYPEIGTEIHPRYRFMSAFEQKVEQPPDKDYQYLLVAAEPYETVAFKLQAREVDRSPGKFWTHYDKDTKEFFLQLFFKTEREQRFSLISGSSKLVPILKAIVSREDSIVRVGFVVIGIILSNLASALKIVVDVNIEIDSGLSKMQMADFKSGKEFTVGLTPAVRTLPPSEHAHCLATFLLAPAGSLDDSKATAPVPANAHDTLSRGQIVRVLTIVLRLAYEYLRRGVEQPAHTLVQRRDLIAEPLVAVLLPRIVCREHLAETEDAMACDPCDFLLRDDDGVVLWQRFEEVLQLFLRQRGFEVRALLGCGFGEVVRDASLDEGDVGGDGVCDAGVVVEEVALDCRFVKVEEAGALEAG
ncbi:hypothetical protein Dda_5978 [Drechslerella dactyloides]|uniref:Matrin-type domain-containing protein n=1 Tax=Drechslerella dactyloides TaxID=74499 RepID=A0AAD6IYW7_DREDA|nr:hypothetical protein Dda_5978 [Drechslerella dactyloides]